MCADHAPALMSIDDHTQLVHADINPKNILVTRTRCGWRVDAVLDWEFSYSGCTYGDAGNMARFGADYPVAGRAFEVAGNVQADIARLGIAHGRNRLRAILDRVHGRAKPRKRGGRDLAIDRAVIRNQDPETWELQGRRFLGCRLGPGQHRLARDNAPEQILHVGA